MSGPANDTAHMLHDAIVAVVDAHATVANAAIDWPRDASIDVLHELDDATQSLAEAEAALHRARRAFNSTT